MSSEQAGSLPEGTDLILLDEIDSTMDEAMRRAPPQRPTWIVARRQTKARGRRGKVWLQPEGNFAGTWLTAPAQPAAQVALASFIAAMAVYDTLVVYVARERLQFKWPNDVLLDGRKVAGILLESSGRNGAIDWLAVGIGINLVSAPPLNALPEGAVAPTCLSEAGTNPAIPLTAEDVLFHLAHGLDMWTKMLARHGFDPIRRIWLRRAARVGEEITVRLPRETLSGIFETVDEVGNLVLSCETGSRRISAGEVFLT